MDINKIQSALQSLKEERNHIDIEKYLQNAAAKKKELDKELDDFLIDATIKEHIKRII